MAKSGRIIRHYRPNLAVLFAVAPFALVAAVMWDRWPALPHQLLVAAVDWADRTGLTWLNGFLQRLEGQWLVTAMLTVLAVCMVYAIFQRTGLLRDARALSRPGNGRSVMAHIVDTISGRPTGFHINVESETWQRMHFIHGRSALTAPLRVCLWAFPVVGFLGTVLGISNAVSDLPGAFEDDSKRQNVLDGLHVAFDTTFVGLFASVVLIVGLHVLDGAWDRNELLLEAPDGETGGLPDQTGTDDSGPPAEKSA